MGLDSLPANNKVKGYCHREPWLDRRILVSGISWETVAWLAILIVAGSLRFYNLGEMALSFDESQHALFSLNFYQDGHYAHNPVTHGPLLFHLNALIYVLWGASDFTSRLAPATAGLLAIASMYLFRPLLGRIGALASALLICISPSLLFYSRYIRNDIYVGLFSLLWVYSTFRYLATRRLRWLILLVGTIALAFTTKETAFIFGATVGGFLVLWGLLNWSKRRATGSWIALWDLAFLKLSLVLPFASPLLYFALGWPVTDYSGAGSLERGLVAIGFLLALSVLIAWYRFGARRAGHLSFRRWAGLMALFWSIEILLFSSLLTNVPGGLLSGVVGSLGYWLTQQEVGRGGQPGHYYLVLAVVYDFLPFLLATFGLAHIFFRPNQARIPNPPKERKGNPLFEAWTGKEANQVRAWFLSFLTWWVVSSWVLYSAAGEKMPWLLTQVTLPMTLLGGWWIGRLLSRIDWAQARKDGTVWVIALIPFLGLSLIRALTSTVLPQADLGSIQELTRFIGGLLGAGVLGTVCWKLLRQKQKIAVRFLTLGLVLSLIPLTVLTSYQLVFRNFNGAAELLVYAHSTSDIKKALSQIDVIRGQLAEDKEIGVAYDDETNWPFGWYLKRRPNTRFYGKTLDPDSRQSEFILVGPSNYDDIRPKIDSSYTRIEYTLVEWPNPAYWEVSVDSVLDVLRHSEKRRALWEFWLNRAHRASSPQPHHREFELYVKEDMAWAFSKRAPERLLPSGFLTGPFDGLPLKQPRDVAVTQEGSYVIADTGNNRIVVVDANGEYKVFGRLCALSRGNSEGCTDPDGIGPAQWGDGQFDEPWGVAVSGEGHIFVADTWNGRIQVFSEEGRFLTKWGTSSTTDGWAAGAYSLYGPRELVIDPQGRILVSDTGNKRIVAFKPNGDFIMESGGAGTLPGQFSEPVGLAVSVNREHIFVADAWNSRIQKLTPDFEFVTSWRVPSWRDGVVEAKPYLTVDSAGRLLASDPENHRVLLFGQDGTVEVEFGLPGSELGQFNTPNGLAYDETQETLLVADSGNNRILIYTLPPGR